MTNQSEDRDSDGKFLPGNTIWQVRSTYGRNREYEDGEALWVACYEYFEWAHGNPLKEAKVLGSGDHVTVDKMRALTQKALCLHLRISEETWRTWRVTRGDLKDVIQTVDAIIFTQKFEGAAAGLLSTNIISRDLGLADRQEITGRDGGPVETTDVSDIEVARRIAFVLAQGVYKKAELDAKTGKENQHDQS